jgi:hypothetical protein
VVDAPEHIPVLAVVLRAGVGFTVIVMVLEAVQPAALVPVTV